MTTLGGPNQKLPEPENDLDELGINEDDIDDESSGSPPELDICTKYLELMRDPMMRIAITGVVVVDGKISSSKSRQKLKQWFDEIGYQAFEMSQMQLLAFLNSIWFVGCESLSTEFWWVYRNIILKLAYVACVAEACNLQKYGVVGKGAHIPRAALFIYDYIKTLEESMFEELETEFKELRGEHEEFCQVFLKCFEPAEGARAKTESKHKPKKK